MDVTETTSWAVRDLLTGAVYRQPNKLIAEKVTQMHGASEVIPYDEKMELRGVVSENGPTVVVLGRGIIAIVAEDNTTIDVTPAQAKELGQRLLRVYKEVRQAEYEADLGILPLSEIQSAAMNWRAVADGIARGEIPQGDDADYQRGLSEGYASALEMVLRRGGKKS